MGDDASSQMIVWRTSDRHQTPHIIDIFEVSYAKGPKGQKIKFWKNKKFVFFNFENFDFFSDYRIFEGFSKNFEIFKKITDIFSVKKKFMKKNRKFYFSFFFNIPSVNDSYTKGELLKVSLRYRTWLSRCLWHEMSPKGFGANSAELNHCM